MVGIVDLGRRPVGAIDAVHAHRAEAAGAVELLGEHGAQRAVGFPFAAGDAAGVGEVRGGGIHPHELRRHGPLGDVEHGHRAGHRHSPFSARVTLSMRPRRKSRVAEYCTAVSAKALCSVAISTVLPSRLVITGTRYCTAEFVAASVSMPPRRAWRAALKSMSRALYPGVAAFAILEPSIPRRCDRTSSAAPRMPKRPWLMAV